MKNNWFLISLFAGIAAGFLSFLIVKSWKVNLIIGIVVLIIMLINNPTRRYIRAFWVILGMFSLMHRFSFEIIGSITGIDFHFGSTKIHWIVSFGLLVLAAFCLLLYFLEKNGKLIGTIFSIKKNKVGDINGDGNEINQTNV